MNCRTSRLAVPAASRRASLCISVKSVGIVITAALTSRPRKSVAEAISRRRWRDVTSDTGRIEGSASSLSLILKAVNPSSSIGWADACEFVGSMSAYLGDEKT